MSAERISDFERIPTMIRCSHLDAIIIFYHIGSLRQFESIHQKVRSRKWHSQRSQYARRIKDLKVEETASDFSRLHVHVSITSTSYGFPVQATKGVHSHPLGDFSRISKVQFYSTTNYLADNSIMNCFEVENE